MVWDLIVVAIFAVFIFFAWKRGLFDTLFGLAATVASLIGTWIFSGPVGTFIHEAFVFDTVRKTVVGAISDSPIVKYEEAVANLDVVGRISSMPDALKKLLDSVGLDSAAISQKAASIGSSTLQAKNDLIDSIATPISTTISTAIAFIVLFVVLTIVLKIAAKLLSKLFKLLPLGKKVDSIGGLLVGFAEGAVIVLVLTAVLWGVSSGTTKGIFSRETMEQTVITKEIVKINPICSFLTAPENNDRKS